MDEEEVKVYSATKKKHSEVNYLGKNSRVGKRDYAALGDDFDEDEAAIANQWEYGMGPMISTPKSPADSNISKLEDLDKNVKSETVGDIDFKYFRYFNAGKPLNGEYKLTDDGQIHSAGYSYWFFEGIMVSAEGYLEIARKMIETHEDIFTTIASVSRYPVFAKGINDCFRNREARNLLVYRGEVFSGSVAPAFCSHAYTIEGGKFVGKKIRKVEPENYYVDQLWKKDVKSGILRQILQISSNNVSTTQEKAPDEGSDEIERAKQLAQTVSAFSTIKSPSKTLGFDKSEQFMKKALESTQDEVEKIINKETPSDLIEERLRKVVENVGLVSPPVTQEEIDKEELEITDSTEEALDQMRSDEIPEDYLVTIDKEELAAILEERVAKLSRKIDKMFHEFREIEDARDLLGYGVTQGFLNNLNILEHAKETVALYEQQ